MKIVLLNPPFEESYSAIKDKRKKAILEILQPLGIAYIAAVLERDNYQVKLFDCALGSSQYELFGSLRNEQPDIVGITATSLSFRSAQKVAMDVRKFFPKSIIIIGGPHVTALPYEVMSFEYFDVAVIGEGEITFLELVKRIEESGLGCLEYINGIAFRKNGNVVLTGKRNFIKDLNALPFPARHLLPPLSKYSPSPASYRKLPMATIITSRGCPMKCSFCDQAVFGSFYRLRNAESILDEIEIIKNKFGAKEIRFYDDNFTWNEKRILEICNKLKKRNIKIPWVCFASVNSVSKNLLKEMKSAGCWQILYGLESGDENVLKFLKKKVTIADNERAVRWAKEVGLSIRALFIVGSPWETKESLQRTLDFAKRFNIDYAHFNKFIPYPGSEAYKMLINKGYRFDFTQRFSMFSHADIMYIPDSLTKKEFINFLARARKEFYFRFSYILRRAISIVTWVELKAQILGFLALILRSNICNHEKNTSK